jgi:N-acetyl-gamma-glutamyl-phosphate reductase
VVVVGSRVAVAGATGYAGAELLRLLAGHPSLELAVVTGHSRAGARLGAVHPHLAAFAEMPVTATSAAALADVDLVFLALPHGESGPLAAQLPPAVKVVDLGADHRLRDPDSWAGYYGGRHAGAWTYGLPELPGRRSEIARAARVANTGCYAVATILALTPLLAAGVVEPHDVVVVAASGTSGAGRALRAELLATEVMSSMSPYKVGAHQHVPEIKEATGARSLSLTPLLAPMPRGILATVTARPTRAQTSPAAVREVLSQAYAGEPFVRVLPDGAWPHTSATLGSNSTQLQATVDRDSGRVLVVSALDNLGKGAAGQAIQCANLMLGLPETAGLTANGVGP